MVINMPDMQSIKDILIKAGLFPSILTVGGFFYAFILLLALLYYLFLYIVRAFTHKKR